MSKGKLEFDLPEEREEFELAQNAGKYAYVLYEYDQFLRGKVKYAPDTMPEDVHKALEEAREKLWEIANQEGVDF